MQFFLYMSDLIVPFLILGIVIYGISMNVDVYDTFIKGARSGFLTVIKIMPTLIGLMVAVGILRASGFLVNKSGDQRRLPQKTSFTFAGALGATCAGLAASVVLAGMM